MKRTLYLATIAALSAAVLASGAYAENSTENDALAVANATIDLRQAVATAEQHVGGKASRAEYERHKGQWVFDVEVAKGTSVMDVKVDAANGRIIEATADGVDRDDRGDRED